MSWRQVLAEGISADKGLLSADPDDVGVAGGESS
jgi:hypothetical protein